MVDVPRVATVETHVPSVADVRQLLAATTGDRLYPLWMLAVHTGARRGELLGLQWSDLDWAAGTLSIRRGLASTAKGAPVFDETKSRRSRRTLTVPTTVLECLRAHQAAIDVERAKVGTYYQEYGLMFPTSIGTAPSARNVLRSFKAALAAAGLPDATRFHDLRHAAATAMLAAGVPLKVASERLGHSAVAITADLYTHRVASLEADAAERLAVLFAPEEGDDG
jgi:integrase